MVQMTTNHSSICPPPLPPSQVPLLLSALPTTRSLSFFILLFPFAPTLILLLPPPPASDADSPSLLLHQSLPMDFPPALNLLTEFGCGFVLLRSLSRIFNLLGLFLILTFCFKVLCFGWNSKNALRFLCDSDGVPKIRFCLDKVVSEKVSKAKTKPLKKPRHPTSRSSFQTSGSGERGNAVSDNGSEGKGENEREGGNEDEVFDVMKLRRIVRMERQKANAAFADLEKERTAASSSAEEAMAMILRLQSEKSAAEIQATQFRRMAEQKLDYDNEVIESLQWTITQHEFQKCEVEDRIEMCREELRQFMRDEEIGRIEDEVSRSFMYENENDNDNDDPDGNSVGSSPETESQT